MKERIIKILKQHETTTYPNGVGIPDVGVDSLDYGKVADDIVKLLVSEDLKLRSL